MSFICMRMKNNFHIKGWALNLVLIQRPGETRKSPIDWSLLWLRNWWGKSGWFLALTSLFQALRLEGLARGKERSETDRQRQNQTKTRLWGNGREDSQINSPQFPLCFSLRPQDLLYEFVRVFCPGRLSVSLAIDSCQICTLQSDNKKYGKYVIEKKASWF